MKKPNEIVVKMTINGVEKSGRGELEWKESSKYGVAHYEGRVIIPMQDVRRVHLYVYDKLDINTAIDKLIAEVERSIFMSDLF